MPKNTGGPAFPRPMGSIPSGSQEQESGAEGMTLHEYYAGQAMVGLLARLSGFKGSEISSAAIAKNADELAGAMLEAVGK